MFCIKTNEKLYKIAPQIHNYSLPEMTGLEIIEEMFIDNNIEINNKKFLTKMTK